ncbi:hypothethical protein (plasmid) [Ralstonia solanacearum PSI07]|nr:hypothethical protein [Ralstonia solanacearum PSI07]
MGLPALAHPPLSHADTGRTGAGPPGAEVVSVPSKMVQKKAEDVVHSAEAWMAKATRHLLKAGKELLGRAAMEALHMTATYGWHFSRAIGSKRMRMAGCGESRWSCR